MTPQFLKEVTWETVDNACGFAKESSFADTALECGRSEIETVFHVFRNIKVKARMVLSVCEVS